MTTSIVSSGQTSYGTVLERGDVQHVYGTAINTRVHAGGREEVHAGGTVRNTTVSGYLYDSHAHSFTRAALVVSSGGLARNTMVLDAANLVVERGGDAWNTVVNERHADDPTSYEIVSAGGVTHYTVLQSYGWEVVSSGGLSLGTHINGDSGHGGASEQVQAGGTAIDTTVNVGVLYVDGTASNTAVHAGGREDVHAGGTAINTVVSGSRSVVSAGRYVPNAELAVDRGGVAIDTTLDNTSIALNDGTLAFRGDRTFAEQGVIRGSGALVVSGAGTTVQLLQNNTYTGGTRIDAGVLQLNWPDAAGTGPITFLGGSTGTLKLEQTIVSNTISGFLPGTTIDLGGFGLANAVTLGAGNVLTVGGGRYGPGGQAHLNLDPTQSYASYTFRLTADGHGGTDLTVVPTQPSNSTGT